MAPELHLLGISFRTASESVREGLAFSPSQTAELLAKARQQLPGVEAVVLSTCNRTEFYLAGPEPSLVDGWHALLRALRPEAPALDQACARYQARGAEAYRHLCRVAGGLDSALLGDSQILGQVRRAVALSQDCGALGAMLSPAFAAALRLGRRARAETEIGIGAPGVGSAVAEALRAQAVGPGSALLVLGSGQAARAVTRSLVKAGFHHLLVSARNDEAATQIASECGATAVPWAEREFSLRSARVVVVATAAPAPVLTSLPLGSMVDLVVDAGFPRQVDAGVGVEVISLLSLMQQADDASQRREAAVPAVEALIAEEVARWQLGRERAPLERAIKDLHADAAKATRAAAEQLSSQAGLCAEDVEKLLAPQVRRLLHAHVTRLRSLHPHGA